MADQQLNTCSMYKGTCVISDDLISISFPRKLKGGGGTLSLSLIDYSSTPAQHLSVDHQTDGIESWISHQVLKKSCFKMKVHLYLITSVLLYILGGKESLVVPYVALVQHPKSRFNNNTRNSCQE